MPILMTRRSTRWVVRRVQWAGMWLDTWTVHAPGEVQPSGTFGSYAAALAYAIEQSEATR